MKRLRRQGRIRSCSLSYLRTTQNPEIVIESCVSVKKMNTSKIKNCVFLKESTVNVDTCFLRARFAKGIKVIAETTFLLEAPFLNVSIYSVKKVEDTYNFWKTSREG